MSSSYIGSGSFNWGKDFTLGFKVLKDSTCVFCAKGDDCETGSGSPEVTRGWPVQGKKAEVTSLSVQVESGRK